MERYNIVFFLVTYLMPMLGMMVCYFQVTNQVQVS